MTNAEMGRLLGRKLRRATEEHGVDNTFHLSELVSDFRHAGRAMRTQEGWEACSKSIGKAFPWGFDLRPGYARFFTGKAAT